MTFFSKTYVPVDLQKIIISYIDTKMCSLCDTVVSRELYSSIEFKCVSCNVYIQESNVWKCGSRNEDYSKGSSKKNTHCLDTLIYSSNIYKNLPDISYTRFRCDKKVKHGRRSCFH